MTPEEHQILMETRQLAEENAEILRGMDKRQRTSSTFKVIYWVIIIVLSFASYFLIQPYLNSLKDSVSDITGSDTTGQ